MNALVVSDPVLAPADRVRGDSDPVEWGGGIRLIPSFAIPRGQAFFVADTGTWHLHYADYWTQLHKGGFPLWTRYMLGVREAERDRRKYR